MRGYMKITVGLLLILWGAALLTPQEKQTEPGDVTEYVEVLNVELIVRAMRDGNAVGGLKTADFTLLENGKQLPITSFTEVRRKIGEKKIIPVTKTAEAPAKTQKKRLLLLYFWLTERGLKYKEALDYFFEKVYSPGDRALLVVKNKVFDVTRPEQVKPAVQWLDKQVIKAATDILSDQNAVIRTVDSLFRDYLNELYRTAPDLMKLQMLRRQIEFAMEGSWLEFRTKNLLSNSRKLIDLADELKKMDMEKWGMVFYQENAFPEFDMQMVDFRLERQGFEQETAEMKRFIRLFRLKTRLPNNTFFNSKKIEQAFVNGDATFHVLWMDAKTEVDVETRTMAAGNVYSGWLETFKGISRVTGGQVMRANKLKESLIKVVDREDIFYRITYAPSENKDKRNNKKRKIKVTVKDKTLKVIHIKKVNATRRGPQPPFTANAGPFRTMFAGVQDVGR